MPNTCTLFFLWLWLHFHIILLQFWIHSFGSIKTLHLFFYILVCCLYVLCHTVESEFSCTIFISIMWNMTNFFSCFFSLWSINNTTQQHSIRSIKIQTLVSAVELRLAVWAKRYSNFTCAGSTVSINCYYILTVLNVCERETHKNVYLSAKFNTFTHNTQWARINCSRLVDVSNALCSFSAAINCDINKNKYARNKVNSRIQRWISLRWLN